MRKLLNNGSAITGREANLYAAYDFDLINNKAINKSNRFSDLRALSFRTSVARDPIYGTVLDVSGDGSVATGANGGVYNISSISSIDTKTAGTIMLSVKVRALPTTSAYILKGAGASSSRYYATITSAGELRASWGSVPITLVGPTLVLNKWYRVAITWLASSSLAQMYVDGKFVTSGETMTMPNNAESILFGCNDAVGNYGLNGQIADICWYSNLLTANDIKNDYLKYARRTQFSEDFGTAKVSPLAEGGIIGGYLSNTLFRFADTTGRFQIVDATINGKATKSIKCTTAGVLYIPVQALGMLEASPETAYGTWEWCWKKTGASASNVGFISSTADIATMNGYWFQLDNAEYIYLRRITGGASVITLMAAGVGTFPVDTWARVTITRRYDGCFSVYKDGVLVAPLVGTNPTSTDATYTSGNYMVFNMGVSDEISLLSKRFGDIS